MDALTHLIFSFVVGYLFLKAINREYNIKYLVFLSFFSNAIDLDNFYDIRSPLHNIFLILLLSLFVISIFSFSKKIELRKYSLIYFIMTLGHIFLDLFPGYGALLFYPFSQRVYSIPEDWVVNVFPDVYSPLIGPVGILLLAYFLVIRLIVFIIKNRKLRI